MRFERMLFRTALACALVWMGCASTITLAAQDEMTAELIQRRQAVMENMKQRGMLILFSAEPRTYSRDVSYEFRQESNFFYLTGIRQSGVTLVLVPENQIFREILLLPDRNPHTELWTGKMLSTQEAMDISGIANVWSATEFEPFLNSVLYGRPYRTDRYSGTQEYQRFFRDLAQGEADVFLLLESKPGLQGESSREFRFANRLRERFPGIEIRDISSILDRLRLIKSPFEVAQIRQAIEITIEAHLEAMRCTRPGIWEYEVEAVIEYIFKRRNSFDWAFPSIVASGPNATTLHYQNSQRQLQAGDLLLIDIGADYNYYAADITRTIPVSGTFNREQKQIYELVLKAQQAALALIQPDLPLKEVHLRAAAVIREGLADLGLIADANSDQYRVFFPHGTTHHLGLDVHDVGNAERLQPGMVLTVEPGIYVRQDSADRLLALGTAEAELKKIEKTIKRYMSIGVRIEDDILVTERGHEILSRRLPRTINAVETEMANTKSVSHNR